MNVPFPPLLALEIGEIIGIIFLVLSVLGWFVKVVQGKGDEGPKGPARRQQNERVRMEIETFLDEISANKPQRPAAKPAPPPPRPAERPRPAAAKAAKKPAKPQVAVKQAKRTSKPLSSLQEKHLQSSNLGSGLRSHVSDYMQSDRIADEVKQDLTGVVMAEEPASSRSSVPSVAAKPVHPIVSVLRNPQGVRQAIVIQEIMQRPRSLRRQG